MNDAPECSMPEPRPLNRHMNVALIVSLCINLVLAGVIATAAFRIMTHEPPMGLPKPPEFEQGKNVWNSMAIRRTLSPRLFLSLVPDKADAMRGIMRSHRDRIDELRLETSAARAEVKRVFGAPEFDKVAFDKALQRMQAADMAMGDEGLKMASEAAALLSLEERKRILEWQPRGHGFGHGFGRGFAPGDGPRGEGRPGDERPGDGPNGPPSEGQPVPPGRSNI